MPGHRCHAAAGRHLKPHCCCTVQDWHQKLHNNTTPDDVSICEAYIAFLEGNGDNGAYWRVLSDSGTPAFCIHGKAGISEQAMLCIHD